MSRHNKQSKHHQRRERKLAELVRKECPACASTALRWMDEPHALKLFGPVEVRRARVCVGRGLLDFWRCESCAEWGALSAAQAF